MGEFENRAQSEADVVHGFVPILRDPYQVILDVPDRAGAMPVLPHPSMLAELCSKRTA
jgi:hypothetical protein